MPIFFQHQINDNSRLGIWKIEETEDFFKGNVPQHRDVSHPHKRLQHLAGRFLLQYLFPDFPYELIRIADTRKPFLRDEQYHFSISHCGDYAAAIVSRRSRVGIDIEIPVEKILRIRQKFLHPDELDAWTNGDPAPAVGDMPLLTLLWSAKEAVFKWYGDGAVDFREDIRLQQDGGTPPQFSALFAKTNQQLRIDYRQFDQLTLAWVIY